MDTKIDTIKMLLSKDKRKTDRLLMTLKARYSIAESNILRGPVHVTHIGGGGLKFTSGDKIPKQTEVTFKIELPKEPKPIILKGLVVWCRKALPPQAQHRKKRSNLYDIGVKFYGMEKKHRQKFINFFCDSLLSEFLNSEGQIK